MLKRILILALCGGLLGGAVVAQKSAVEEIVIKAGKAIEYQPATRTAIATGGVVLTSSEGTLKAARMTLKYDETAGDLESATAEGTVRIELQQGPGKELHASCDRAVYDRARQVVRLSGNVDVTMTDPSYARPAHGTGAQATVQLAAPRKITIEGDGGPTVLRIYPRKKTQ